MSDMAAQRNGVLEPDEEVLISALRNQDDIPILMDIVAEQVAACPSQEDHLIQSLDETDGKVEAKDTDISTANFSQELISKSIADVLERRLPELVAEVIQTLYSSDAAIKKE